MNGVCACGVVKGGQVVLDAPLPLADGTRVAVAIETDNSPVGPDKLDMTEEERRTAMEDLILETIRIKGSPAEIAEVERLVRESRGVNG